MFAGAVFFLHVFFSVILIIAYSIFLSITSQGMTTEGFITVVAVGYICSIVVALRMFLGKIEADKYFQNTSSTKSLQSSIGEPLPSTENRHTSKKIEAPALNNNIEQYICPILRAKFVLIPAGTFMMGSPETEIDRRDDETLHQVTISKPFYLQTTTITQGQWSLVMGSNPSRNLSGTDKPVDTVSWENVQEYIRKLNQMVKGAFYRLPTEAEWEYACRAGSTKAFCFGDDDGLLSLDDNAWWYGNSGTDNHPVGLKKPNNWGLYDMHGNVREWLQDWYGNYTSNSVTDPVGPSSGTQRVIRGGCYASSRERCRSAARDQLYPRINCYPGKIGFRLALCANVNETA